MTAISQAIYAKGQYVRATKLTGKGGATLPCGEPWEGTLHLDIALNNPIWIDEPGLHWLVTTAIQSIILEADHLIVRTGNSEYRVERCESFIDRINRATKESRG